MYRCNHVFEPNNNYAIHDAIETIKTSFKDNGIAHLGRKIQVSNQPPGARPGRAGKYIYKRNFIVEKSARKLLSPAKHSY